MNRRRCASLSIGSRFPKNAVVDSSRNAVPDRVGGGSEGRPPPVGRDGAGGGTDCEGSHAATTARSVGYPLSRPVDVRAMFA